MELNDSKKRNANLIQKIKILNLQNQKMNQELIKLNQNKNNDIELMNLKKQIQNYEKILYKINNDKEILESKIANAVLTKVKINNTFIERGKKNDVKFDDLKNVNQVNDWVKEKTNKKIDSNEKDDLRYKILSFANSLHNGDNHTRQEYETIFMFYDKYEVIISELGIKNGYLETEMNFIRKTYEVKYMEVKYEKDV